MKADSGDSEQVRISDIAELDAAFARFADRGVTRGVLVLAPTVRPDAAFAEAVVSAAVARPGLAELILVHDASSIGFVASSLQLRLPRVSVRAMKRAEAGVAGGDGLRKSGERLRYAIVQLAGDANEASIAASLAELGLAPRIAILFEGQRRPTREVMEHLAPALRGRVGLQEVVLVHASPSIGFMSSTLSLQLPRVKVRVVREASELETLAG
ncbi:MAG: hypothetical protein VYE22_30005 [Myxococcota bacterium]|nr:hypothetical protein [Myxococcota bacterium]